MGATERKTRSTPSLLARLVPIRTCADFAWKSITITGNAYGNTVAIMTLLKSSPQKLSFSLAMLKLLINGLMEFWNDSRIHDAGYVVYIRDVGQDSYTARDTFGTRRWLQHSVGLLTNDYNRMTYQARTYYPSCRTGRGTLLSIGRLHFCIAVLASIPCDPPMLVSAYIASLLASYYFALPRPYESLSQHTISHNRRNLQGQL